MPAAFRVDDALESLRSNDFGKSLLDRGVIIITMVVHQPPNSTVLNTSFDIELVFVEMPKSCVNAKLGPAVIGLAGVAVV